MVIRFIMNSLMRDGKRTDNFLNWQGDRCSGKYRLVSTGYPTKENGCFKRSERCEYLTCHSKKDISIFLQDFMLPRAVLYSGAPKREDFRLFASMNKSVDFIQVR